MNPLLVEELQYRASIGQKPVTVSAFKQAFLNLGYKVDRSMDARGLSQWVTGERAGKLTLK